MKNRQDHRINEIGSKSQVMYPVILSAGKESSVCRQMVIDYRFEFSLLKVAGWEPRLAPRVDA
jgi:hypothetical protein